MLHRKLIACSLTIVEETNCTSFANWLSIDTIIPRVCTKLRYFALCLQTEDKATNCTIRVVIFVTKLAGNVISYDRGAVLLIAETSIIVWLVRKIDISDKVESRRARKRRGCVCSQRNCFYYHFIEFPFDEAEPQKKPTFRWSNRCGLVTTADSPAALPHDHSRSLSRDHVHRWIRTCVRINGLRT